MDDYLNDDFIADHENDEDGEGLGDVIGIDTDGDGIADIFAFDSDGDGINDTYISQTAFDSDGDGINDTFVSQTQIDTDGDGIGDLLITETLVDSDQDDHPDYYSVTKAHDSDGDGDFEHVSVEEDNNGDMIFDSFADLDDVDGTGELELTNAYEMVAGTASMYDEYEHFDPKSMSNEHIIGHPEETADDWHVQQGQTCAIVAQEMVLDDLLGQDFDADDLREIAEDYGWYSGNGTTTDDIGKILALHGLNVEQHIGASYDDLRNSVMESGHAIVGIDSNELWNNDHDDLAPGEGCGHAVDVIGLDESDPEHVMVILNDSGAANGNAVMVPWEDFQDAWEAFGSYMVSIDTE